MCQQNIVAANTWFCYCYCHIYLADLSHKTRKYGIICSVMLDGQKMKYSESQEKVIARAHATLAWVVIFAFFAGVVWLASKFFERTASATLPVMLGLFLSMIARPCVDRLEGVLDRSAHILSKAGGVRLWAVALFGMFLLVSVFAMLYLFGNYVVDQFGSMFDALKQSVEKLAGWLADDNSAVSRFFGSLGCLEFVRGLDVSQGLMTGGWDFVRSRAMMLFGDEDAIAQAIGTGFLRYISNVGSWFMTIVFCAVFLVTKIDMNAAIDKLDGKLLSEFFREETRSHITEMLKNFCRIMVRYFGRQLVVCVLEGLYFGVSFWIVGLPHGFIIGFMQGLLNFIPFIGTVACLPIIILTAYCSGGLPCLAMVGIVWGVGQMLDGFILPAQVHGKDYKLEPWLVLFSFMFWGSVFNSVLGMALAVPMTAFVKSAWLTWHDQVKFESLKV